MCGPINEEETFCDDCTEVVSENRYKAWKEIINELCKSCQGKLKADPDYNEEG